uniref:MAGUK p55 scaffold protein 3 n=1 Tax=Ailuropoda melanoleuca TaxID=9646 RepID=A0A7N5KR96_AILME
MTLLDGATPLTLLLPESAGRARELSSTDMPVLSEDSGLHETLALLTSQLRPDSNHKEEMGFLRDVFSEKSLSYLMKIHEKLRYYERQSPTPVLHSAVALAEDVMEELQAASVHSDERELLQLLSTPHLRAMLVVHDTVAQKNFDPVLPPLPDNIGEDFDEESVKIIRLVKNKEPLGATIRRDEHSGAVVVARIMRGGAADRSGAVPGIHYPENHPSHPGGRPFKGQQGVHAGALPLQPARGPGHPLPGGRPALPAPAGPGGGEPGRPHMVAGQASRGHQPSSWPHPLQAVPGKATKLPESHRHPAEPAEPQEASLDL